MSDYPETDRVTKSTGAWIKLLADDPKWREYKAMNMAYVMDVGEGIPGARRVWGEREIDDAPLSVEVENQRRIVKSFYMLIDSLHRLEETEHYFRAYPFRKGEVSKAHHLRNCCEMYFNSFYLAKHRFGDHLNEQKAAGWLNEKAVGWAIKHFSNEFDGELRWRHTAHHGSGFEDAMIDYIFFSDLRIFGEDEHKDMWKGEARRAYRSWCKSWARRVRKRSKTLAGYIEVTATLLRQNADFLNPPRLGPAPAVPPLAPPSNAGRLEAPSTPPEG